MAKDKTKTPISLSNLEEFKNQLSTVAISGSYKDLLNIPATFTPSAHNQASSTINAMTGYTKPTSTSAIAASDTLNAAIGKIEKALDGKQPIGSYVTSSGTAAKASADANGNIIADTYVKSVSISGRTVTITKGNGSSETQTTQDTTYTPGAGLSLSGTQFINTGVRSVVAGATPNILTINTGGTTSSITINKVDYAARAGLHTIKSSNEINLDYSETSWTGATELYFNYRGTSTDKKVTNYRMWNGAGSSGALANVTADTFVGKLSGNATTATALANSRAIDGVNFNGSSAISHYGTCSTAAGTVEKVVALSGFTLVTGARVTVKFTVTNTAASPTLNVNSTGAKAIYYRGAAIGAGYLAANRTYEFIYNGTQYELLGDLNVNNLVTQTAVTDSSYTNYRPLVWGASNSGTKGFTPSTVTDGVFTCTGLYVQPSSGLIHATTFEGALSGNATSATKATQDGNGATISSTYLKLAGGTMTGDVYFPNSKGIIQNQNSTSNYTSAIRWKKVADSYKAYLPSVGCHNTGGDGTGSITILPYETDADPWSGSVGLFIAKNTLKLDGTSVSMAGHTHNYAGSASAGGPATSALTASKVNASIAAGSAADIVYSTMAGSDQFRIRVFGDTDSGQVEIATADNGTEPIYVRQYSGVFTTLTRSATLLDASGNTSFPGTVTAPTFKGALSGNATTATTATKANYINVNTISAVSSLSSANNGWYTFSGTISGTSGTWMITKMGSLYTATNVEDPRIMLNSNDLSTWVSPYAYWHA